MDQVTTPRNSDVYQRVTAEIIKAIESDIDGEYMMPWHRGTTLGLPRNVISRRSYHGLNTLALWTTAGARHYRSPFWGTFLQWKKLGAHVRKGERGTLILFFKKEEGERNADQECDTEKRRVLVCSSAVFNAAQIDGWQDEATVLEDRTVRLEAVERFINGIGAKVEYGGDRAFYQPSADRIRMPERSAFIGTKTSSATESFYAVLLHEHVHWSGHPSRLNRDLTGRFGTDAYAMEELVAELGAAFLCAGLGVSNEPRKDHALYVKSWLPVLREKKLALASTATAATSACRYLADLSTPVEQAA